MNREPQSQETTQEFSRDWCRDGGKPGAGMVVNPVQGVVVNPVQG